MSAGMHLSQYLKHHKDMGNRMEQAFEGINTSKGDFMREEVCEPSAKCSHLNGFDHHIVEPLHDQNCAAEPVALLDDHMPNYEVGDLVWAKVKSHPWWPAQVFDAAYASTKAKSMRRPGRILVAFYGDHTFAWLEHSQILELKPNFEAKVKATTTKSFQFAVSEVLNEVCRRAQLGLQCQFRKSCLENGCTLGDVKDGVQVSHEGLRLHKDVRMSKANLNSRRSLSFLKDQALSPCKSFSSSLEASVLHGHVLGIRTGFFADIGKDLDSSSECPLPGTSKCVNATWFASTQKTAIDNGEPPRCQTECRKRGNAAYEKSIFSLEDRRAKRCHIAGSAVDNEDSLPKRTASTYRGSNVDTEALLTSEGPYLELPKFTGGAGKATFVKDDIPRMFRSNNKAFDQEKNTSLELSKKQIYFFRAQLELMEQNKSLLALSLNEPSSLCDEKASSVLMRLSEALQFLAIDPLGHHGLYNTMVRVVPVFLKFRDLVFQKSAGYGTHLRASGKIETQMTNAQHVDTGTEHDSLNLVAKAVRYWRPTSQKYRSVENSDVLNNYVQQIMTPEQFAAPTKVSHEGQKLSSDRGWEKRSEVLGTSPEGVAQKCAAPTKLSHEGQKLSSDRGWEKRCDVLGRNPEGVSQAHSRTQKTVFSQKLDVHELLLEAQKKKTEITKEAPGGKVQEKALETSASKLFSEVHTDVWVDAKQQVETKPLRDPIEELPEAASKMFAFERHVFPEATADTGRSAEPVFKTNIDIGEFVEHFSKSATDIEVSAAMHSTTKPEHVFQGLSDSVGNMESSTQIPHYGASLQLPVGLFMKFPSSFALPSETQLNATFTPFGALETAGTRVFRDTASAQVIFKHGNQAETAYKYVKEINPFGKAPVAFRLQHFAHS